MSKTDEQRWQRRKAERPGEIIEAALEAVLAAAPARDKLKQAQRAKKLPRKLTGEPLWAAALEAGVVDASEVELLRAADRARDSAIQVDAFEPTGELAAAF